MSLSGPELQMPVLWRENANRTVQGLETLDMSRLLSGTPVFGNLRLGRPTFLPGSCFTASLPTGIQGLATFLLHCCSRVRAHGDIDRSSRPYYSPPDSGQIGLENGRIGVQARPVMAQSWSCFPGKITRLMIPTPVRPLDREAQERSRDSRDKASWRLRQCYCRVSC